MFSINGTCDRCGKLIGLWRWVIKLGRPPFFCSRRCCMAHIRDVEKGVNGDLALYKHPAVMALAAFLIGTPAYALETGKTVVLTKGLACDTARQLLDVMSGAKVSKEKYLEKLAIYSRMHGHGGVACGISENVRMVVVEVIGTVTIPEHGDFYLVNGVTMGGVSLFTALSVSMDAAKPEETAL